MLQPAASGRAASGLLLATDVADYLVSKGLPFRDAHEVVGALVRRLLKEGRSFDELSRGRMEVTLAPVRRRRRRVGHTIRVSGAKADAAVDAAGRRHGRAG